MNFSTIVSITSNVSALKVTMASRRLRNSGLKTRSIALFERLRVVLPRSSSPSCCPRGSEADRPLAHLPRAGVARHDQHDLPEVGLTAVVVGQRRVVHHLQQDVEDVAVRLLDLVEQQHRVGMLPDRVDEQAALLEAHVAGRRANQPRDGVLLHVLRHVEADELVAQMERELPGELRLADAGGTGEQEASAPAGRAARAPARARLIAAATATAPSSCPKTTRRSDSSSVLQALLVRGVGLLLGDAGHARDDALDLSTSTTPGASDAGRGDRGAACRWRRWRAAPRICAGLVENVDGAVGQAGVAQVALGELGRGVDCLVGVGDGVMRLVAAAQALEDLDGLLDRWAPR